MLMICNEYGFVIVIVNIMMFLFIILPIFIDLNECLANPCQHGGTCENLPGSFKCDCTENYEGKLCLNGNIYKLNMIIIK